MRVAIAGAGLGGLAAACELADAGHDVTLLEARPWAGGKTYSTTLPGVDDTVDNGQHIAMRCTTAYAGFLRRIGTLDGIAFQRRLSVPVYDAHGRCAGLKASALPPPLHLAPSFARYRHLSPVRRLRVMRAIAAVLRPEAGEDDVSFGDWLRARGQDEKTIADFWDLVIVPTLNCRSDDASAAAALFILRQGFLRSNDGAAIGVPRVPLAQLHVEPALDYIQARGGDIRLRAAVRAVDTEDGSVTAVILDDGERVDCDACIIAMPPDVAAALLPADVRDGQFGRMLTAFRFAPIVNVHLWLDRPVLSTPFAAFTGGELQWVFAQLSGVPGAHRVAISLSAAGEYLALEKREIVARMLRDLRQALPAARDARVLRSAVIKEPQATFVPAPRLRRPPNETPVRGLFLAGAYTDTGWPATMESAVRSGTAAARAVHAYQPARRALASVASSFG